MNINKHTIAALIFDEFMNSIRADGYNWVTVDGNGAVFAWNVKPCWESAYQWQHQKTADGSPNNLSRCEKYGTSHISGNGFSLNDLEQFTRAESPNLIWSVDELLNTPDAANAPVASSPLEDRVQQYLRDNLTISASMQPNGGLLVSLKIGEETFASSSVQLPIY